MCCVLCVVLGANRTNKQPHETKDQTNKHQQANTQPNKQTDKQASKRTHKQTNKLVNKPTNQPTNKQQIADNKNLPGLGDASPFHPGAGRLATGRFLASFDHRALSVNPNPGTAEFPRLPHPDISSQEPPERTNNHMKQKTELTNTIQQTNNQTSEHTNKPASKHTNTQTNQQITN